LGLQQKQAESINGDPKADQADRGAEERELRSLVGQVISYKTLPPLSIPALWNLL